MEVAKEAWFFCKHRHGLPAKCYVASPKQWLWNFNSVIFCWISSAIIDFQVPEYFKLDINWFSSSFLLIILEWPKGAQCPEKIMMKSKEETLPAVPLDMKGTLMRVFPPPSQWPGYHPQVLYRDREKQGQPTIRYIRGAIKRQKLVFFGHCPNERDPPAPPYQFGHPKFFC